MVMKNENFRTELSTPPSSSVLSPDMSLKRIISHTISYTKERIVPATRYRNYSGRASLAFVSRQIAIVQTVKLTKSALQKWTRQVTMVKSMVMTKVARAHLGVFHPYFCMQVSTSLAIYFSCSDTVPNLPKASTRSMSPILRAELTMAALRKPPKGYCISLSNSSLIFLSCLSL